MSKLNNDQYLTSTIIQDDITNEIAKNFDYTFNGETKFEIPYIKLPTKKYNIGLIVGSSGSGKSTILKQFGESKTHTWDNNKAICSHFNDAQDATEKLNAVGFNSIPNWMKPYHVLSNGEQFRANLARSIESNTVIDEFTSVVDRNVAISCSMSINRYIKAKDLTNIVFATCHRDIIEYLQPDWIYDTDLKTFSWVNLRRPTINISIYECNSSIWSMFSKYHYLTGSINKSAKCYVATWNDVIVGFSSTLPLPSGTIKNAYKGHRLVILPEFQGMGIGVNLSNAIALIHIKDGKRFFSKTSNNRLGLYRENNINWKPTSKNKKNRPDYLLSDNNKKFSMSLKMKHTDRVCYSHEFIADKVDNIELIEMVKINKKLLF